jgi:L-malate glycosyltransferase
MRPNVLQLISNFHQGGSERQGLQLARLLKASDQYNIHLACMDKAGMLLAEAEQMGFADIPEYRLTSFYDRNALIQVRRLALYLRKRRIDLFQTHDFYSNILGMAAARAAGVRVRIAARRETFGWRTRTQKIVERRAYSLAHAIVANSEAVRRQLRTEGIADRKIVTIYNGIDLDRFAPAANFNRAEALSLLGLPVAPHLKLVTIVANLRHEVKDHRTFLRAAGRVLAAFPAARFVIAGEGELTGFMREVAAQLGIGGSTFFTGRCTRVAELLAASDVCVLSSKAEGFSNSILEYMAAARPVVVTDVGGAREAVSDGETGYIVPAEADEAMAARILSLLENPERARLMGEHGRTAVKEKFSCGAQLAATEALYDQLLAPHARQIASRLDGAERQIA